jgi:hypothetical protein
VVRTDERRRSARAPLGERLSSALAHAQGFSAEAPVGTLGVVDAVRMAGQPRRPVALVVRVGGFDGTRTVLVPVSSIANVVPETRRIVLRPGILMRRSAADT